MMNHLASATPLHSRSGFRIFQEPYIIILSRNGRVRQFSVKPITWIIGSSLFSIFIIGYFAATAYLFLRDDLLGAVSTHQIGMRHSYEERIANLRTQLERITSRQFLDQKTINVKLGRLLTQQQNLTDQNEQFKKLYQQTISMGFIAQKDSLTSIELPIKHHETPKNSTQKLSGYNADQSPKRLIGNAQRTTAQIQLAQKKRAAHLLSMLDKKNRKVLDIFDQLGHSLRLSATGDRQQNQIGGPFILPNRLDILSDHMIALDYSLELSKKIVLHGQGIPLKHPLPGHKVSSPFGRRIDPFLKRIAVHNGIDFQAAMGTEIYSTARGIVRFAGRKGGYGLMVEIEHINGLKTRYAHLSRMSVDVGQKISAGKMIGLVGSTGRSTGAHLHYEVLKHGKATNPTPYFQAGQKLERLKTSA